MADERDPQVSRRYREMGVEEPPPALDDKILAASRRAVDARPAPLVTPTGRRRWYFPVAAAAVIMLAVAVTVQMERQRPDEEVVASNQPQAQKEMKAESARAAAEAPKPQEKKQFTPEPPPAVRENTDALGALAKQQAESRARADSARDNSAGAAPVSPPVVAQGAPAPPPEPARREMQAERPQASAATGARMMSKVESPDAELGRIAELRRQGKHEEADKALEEFRKRYPDYRMSDELKAKVERK